MPGHGGGKFKIAGTFFSPDSTASSGVFSYHPQRFGVEGKGTNVVNDEISFGDVRKVAAITGLSKSALDKMRTRDVGPPFMRIGRRVLYPLSGPNGLANWAAAQIADGAR